MTNSGDACERVVPLVVGAVYDGGLSTLLALLEWARYLPPHCACVVADALLPRLERRRDAEQTLHAWLWLRSAKLDDARLAPPLRIAQLRTFLQDAECMRKLLSSGRHVQDGLLASMADLHDGAAANMVPLLNAAAIAPDEYCGYALLDAIHRQLRSHVSFTLFRFVYFFSKF